VGEVRSFRLKNADANELSTIVNELYSQSAGSTSARGGNGGGGGGDNPFARIFGQGRGGGGNNNNNQSQVPLLQSKVNAVADPRTNSILVTAAHESMTQIAEMIERLDSTPDKKQRVFVYPLQYADVNNVAGILRGVFAAKGSTGQSGAQSQEAPANRLTQRSVSGATNRNGSNTQGNGGLNR
jgi:general secretion pathway protein D